MLARTTTVVRVSLNNDLAGLWLGVRLQLIGVFLTVVIALGAVTCVAAPNTCPVAPNANLLGLSILYSISIVGNLNGLIGAVAGKENLDKIPFLGGPGSRRALTWNARVWRGAHVERPCVAWGL